MRLGAGNLPLGTEWMPSVPRVLSDHSKAPLTSVLFVTEKEWGEGVMGDPLGRLNLQ